MLALSHRKVAFRLAGKHDFNEIVLDRVFVPADRLVGKEADRRV